MHFIGVSSTDPMAKDIKIHGEETIEVYAVTIDNVIHIGTKGDVVTYGSKEYVCVTDGFTIEGTDIVSSGIWAELGDVSAEGQRIKVLEDTLGEPSSGKPGEEGYVKATGLYEIIESNSAKSDANAGAITTINTTLYGDDGLVGQVGKIDELADNLDKAINTEVTGIAPRLESVEGTIGNASEGKPDEEGYVKATGLYELIEANAANIAINAGNITALETSLSTNYYTKTEVDAKLTWTKFE